MQWTDESGGAYGSDPYGGAGYAHAHGHAGVRTTTVPAESGEPARPVFVDASGRRQRRVLRAARLLLIPAGGYVALLIGALLGGPSISSPFVPQSDSHPATSRATTPDSGHAKERATATATRKNARSTARQTSGTADRPAASAAPTATSTANSSSSRAGSKAAPGSRGRANGSSHKPVK